MAAGLQDGSLHRWEDIAHQHEWRTLFIGNGLSINVWPKFRYDQLVDFAELLPTDEAIFEYEGTPNFEVVLADLGTIMNVGQLCGLSARSVDAVEARYHRIQEALGRAVGAVHPEHGEIPRKTLAGIREHLLEYGWVFTTSYDVLLYWGMAAGLRSFQPFTDLFLRKRAGRDEFDEDYARRRTPAGRTAVCFLHGALHLVVGGDGTTWKLRRGWFESLLERVGRPIPDDPQARTLLVTEGTSRDKRTTIDSNAYLTHCLQRLREQDSPLVVFGSRLGPEDQHLVEALNANPDRPVAVSVRPHTRREIANFKSDVFQRLEADPLLFFDSTTHPLGASAMRSEI